MLWFHLLNRSLAMHNNSMCFYWYCIQQYKSCYVINKFCYQLNVKVKSHVIFTKFE